MKLLTSELEEVRNDRSDLRQEVEVLSRNKVKKFKCQLNEVTAGAGLDLIHTLRWDLPGDGLAH